MAATVQPKSAVDEFHVTIPTIKSAILPSKIPKELSPRNSDDERELKLKMRGMDRDALSSATEQQVYRPTIKLSRSGQRVAKLHPSYTSGVSEEYLAMANACIHDHDYSGPIEIISPRSLTARGPHVPQIVKRDPDEIARISRTPRAPSQPRTRRIILIRDAVTNEIVAKDCRQKVGRRQLPDDLERVSAPKGFDEAREDEYILCKVEPGSKVNIGKYTMGGSESEKGLDIDVDSTSPRPSSTPVPPAERRRSRQGVVPGFKRGDRILNAGKNAADDNSKLHTSADQEGEQCKTSVDSAYSSLTYSSNSIPRTPSGNRPPSGGKRGATCGLTSSSSSGTSSDEWSDVDSQTIKPRERNGGEKHNKELQKNSSETTDRDDELLNEEEAATEKGRSTCTRLSRPHVKITSGKKLRKQSARLGPPKTQQQTASSNTEKVQFVPTPPVRKPKKSKYYRSVPMRLRALPTSFWEEPNRTNASPYTILPPVQPLFHQQENEDIPDIRPVTPPNDKDTSGGPLARQAMATAGCDRPRQRTIIRTGDTDLLWRLFDKVEAKQNQTGIRAKRGRPKRTSYCAMPPPRRALNDNPCIINSITEKLFPKLTLDHRHPIAAMVTSSSLATRQAVEVTTEDSNTKSVATSKPGGSETALNSSMFPAEEDASGTSAAFPPEVAMEMTPSSPSPTLQPKPSPISLPQLVMQKDYSQLLNELAAVL